ncbi:MAG TPA: serine/threonine-protein kinase [Myxococcaceae bacterium]|nr:serine/threonine-protein kinase [Myxococcaceae bacterium]
MSPRTIGPYRVVDTLGSGGAGTVYRAVDLRTSEPVAIKLLRVGSALDPKAARRLVREFETLTNLSHPHVVRVNEVGVHDGYPYLAMELIEGLTLRSFLELEGGMGPTTPSRALPPGWDDDDSESEHAFDLAAFAEEPPSEVMDRPYVPDADSEPDSWDDSDELITSPWTGPWTGPIRLPAAVAGIQPVSAAVLTRLNRPERVASLKDAMLQLCEALAYIHAHGLVHRDLKPSNVMVDEDRAVRLMDFGLAKWLADDTAVTAEGRQVGTFRYMSPEQILGEPLDSRTDLYSLGVMLYELLAGRPPHDGRHPQELLQHVIEHDILPLQGLNREVDPTLARIAHRLLRKEPEQRFQTAEEVGEALLE